MNKVTRRYRSNPDGTQPPSGTSASNHAKARGRKRKKMREQGYTEEEIANVIERMHFEQDCARLGVEEARRLRYERIPEPDDSRYKPKRVDPLLKGPGRAMGDTAKAVRSKKAIVT